jgi:hypothetical protein
MVCQSGKLSFWSSGEVTNFGGVDAVTFSKRLANDLSLGEHSNEIRSILRVHFEISSA